MAEDYRSWSYEDLTAEIQREEVALADLWAQLHDAEENIEGIQKQIVDEQLPQAAERIRRRARTIESLQKRIFARTEDIQRRQERIAALEKSVVEFQIFRASPRTIAAVRRSISAYQGWQTRRYAQYVHEVARLKHLEELQEKEEPPWERLAKLRGELRHWRAEARNINRDITREEARLAAKKAALPKLYRIKIRLYNELTGPEGSPVGMFQGWFFIDAILDPSTRLVKWDWWLTKDELGQAKQHFVGYFKYMSLWIRSEEIGQTYLDDKAGIPYRNRTATYLRHFKDGEPYTKGIPTEYIKKAETMHVEDLITGESNVQPTPNLDPKAENMGVFFEQVMILTENGTIKWQERRPPRLGCPVCGGRVTGARCVWHPTEEQVKKVREELGYG